MEQFLELNTNSLETFERINEAITTDKETVTINMYDGATDKLKSIQLPSFGYLKRELNRLDKNVSSITGLESSSANLRLKDGSYRRIHTAKLKGPSKSITSLVTPTTFKTKLNEFFEDFLNPLLTINLDVSGQIPVDTERIYVERILFYNEVDNAASSEFFDLNYKNQSSIKYATIKEELDSDNIEYYTDTQVIDMPIRDVQYFGAFDVVKVSNAQKSEIVDGVTRTRDVKLFTLNKLTYSDSTKTMTDTEFLKVGDSLAINSIAYSTRYKIVSIDSSKLQVELQLMEGYEAITIGVGMLGVYKDITSNLEIEINLGFDERQVVFVKPIDPISKVIAEFYSPGVGFYSNELTVNQTDGSSKNLATYYKEEVADFGEFIKSLKVDYIPPAVHGIEPNAPALNTSNFKVVQINKHLTDNTTTDKIIKLKSDKLKADQSIRKLQTSIRKKRSLINTKKFKSRIEKDKHHGELRKLVSEKESEVKLFSSAVSEISSTAESSAITEISPKFRIRGFWSIPEPKKVGGEISQDVVQFFVRYRYSSTSGKTSSVEQIEFNDEINQTKKTAVYTNWVEVAGPVKKRGKLNNLYKWISESEEDSHAINFNSLDIPINSGEIVEITIKSRSEAGYPQTPIESTWSDTIKIEFPEGELATTSARSYVDQNILDNIKIEIREDLESIGMYDHTTDSFDSNDKHYNHVSTSIASGFLSGEQNPISLYDKLISMELEINQLKAAAEAAQGELVIKVIDEDGNVTDIQNNTNNKIFAGYYTQEIPTTQYKGAIITKNYKITLSNTKASNLELISMLYGDRTKAPFSSSNTANGGDLFGLGGGVVDAAASANVYYSTEGKYDLVPVIYQNVDTTNAQYNNYFNLSPAQSSQLRGQFMYSRFTDVSGSANNYVTTDIDALDLSGYDRFEYGLSYPITGTTVDASSGHNDYTGSTPGVFGVTTGTNDFIWAGTYDAVTNAPETTNLATAAQTRAYNKAIYLHVDHPLVAQSDSLTPPLYTALEIQSNGMTGMPKTAVLKANDGNGKKQTPYRRIDSIIPDPINIGATITGDRRAGKMSFTADDQYLVGGHSCGSFLYLAPVDMDTMLTDGDNKFGKTFIISGESNSVSIDLVFQYRMTDYYGVGGAGSGRIGGLSTKMYTNMTYSKKIGIDLIDSSDGRFSFDIQLSAKYKAGGEAVNQLKHRMISNYSN